MNNTPKKSSFDNSFKTAEGEADAEGDGGTDDVDIDVEGLDDVSSCVSLSTASPAAATVPQQLESTPPPPQAPPPPSVATAAQAQAAAAAAAFMAFFPNPALLQTNQFLAAHSSPHFPLTPSSPNPVVPSPSPSSKTFKTSSSTAAAK